jgi:hypothetical protein
MHPLRESHDRGTLKILHSDFAGGRAQFETVMVSLRAARPQKDNSVHAKQLTGFEFEPAVLLAPGMLCSSVKKGALWTRKPRSSGRVKLSR